MTRLLASEITLSAHDDGSDNAEIARWLVKVGDHVKLRQPLIAVDYAGTSVEIPVRAPGRLAQIGAGVGARVRTGSRLLLLDGSRRSG